MDARWSEFHIDEQLFNFNSVDQYQEKKHAFIIWIHWNNNVNRQKH